MTLVAILAAGALGGAAASALLVPLLIWWDRQKRRMPKSHVAERLMAHAERERVRRLKSRA